MLNKTLTLFASMALLAGCGDVRIDTMGESNAGSSDVAPLPPEPIGHTQDELNNGTSTTSLFPEVVRILTYYQSTGDYYTCTATAISEDTLLTASHCVKVGNEVAKWVKVDNADGDNNNTEGSYSSYIVMSKDLYSNVYYGTSQGESTYKRDLALVKFGKRTFSRYLPFSYKTNLVTTGTTVTMVGFGGETTKAYGTRPISGTTNTANGSDYGYFNIVSDTATQPYTEGGDSGGPLLYQENGQYYVVGVLMGGSTSGSTKYHVYPALTQAVYNHMSRFLTLKDKYCIEAFRHAYDSAWGGSWAFCVNGSINVNLDASGFSDTYNLYSHGNDSTWNDEISAFTIPPVMTGTFYQHSNFGGGAVTFVNVFPFLDNSVVNNLKDFSFNDMISSWSLLATDSASIVKVQLQNAKTGKCIDVVNGNPANGTNAQIWDCTSGNNNENFTLVETSTANVYLVKNSQSGTCLDVAGGGTTNGTNIQMWQCESNNPNQLFRFEQFPGQNKFHMVNTLTNKCVDVAGGGTTNGTNIQLWECLSSSNASVNNQVFSFKMY
jgi:V8-like Glu-specific endopeptidase